MYILYRHLQIKLCRNKRRTHIAQIVGTGQTIHRAWYENRSPTGAKCGPLPTHATSKYAPNMLLAEPGAITCRVSRSFLRFGHLELFALRGEMEQLRMMADYVCFREYPELLELTAEPAPLVAAGVTAQVNHTAPEAQPSQDLQAPQTPTVHDHHGDSTATAAAEARLPLPEQLPAGSAERYVALYRRVAQRTAKLVAHWLRVGYVQGNMNSDNTLLSGATVDYGPYGWMERFDPLYQPFTSDPRGNFAYIRQPMAMALNVAVLGEYYFVFRVVMLSGSGVRTEFR
jgi:uncharacterized protein YdiU (UPF0061 family)